MTLKTQIQKGVADLSHIIGLGLVYGGGAGLLAMAVIGTVSIDIVLLAYAEKKHDDFMTGWILASMFTAPKFDPAPLLIASPITTLLAVALSIALGVPGTGMALLAGWAVASALLLSGLAVLSFSHAIEPETDLTSSSFSYC